MSYDLLASAANGLYLEFVVTTLGTATLQLTGVQLEAGTLATPFEFRHFSHEVALCQRYFEKSYDFGVSPGTATDVGRKVSTAANASQFYDYGHQRYAGTKRTAVVPALYSPVTGTSGTLRNYTTNADGFFGGASYAASTGSFEVAPSGATTGHILGFHWAANAELS